MTKIKCAFCGDIIENSYLKIMDNFLQIKYFEEQDGSDNIFCSNTCLRLALMVEEIDISEEER